MTQKWTTHPLAMGLSLICVVVIMAVVKTDWSLGEVSGRVTLDGKPVRGITLIMQPDEGRPSQGTTDANGNYVMHYTLDKDGVRIGKANVYFESFRPGIPFRYFSPFEELEIRWGANRFDVRITSDDPVAYRSHRRRNKNDLSDENKDVTSLQN